MQILGAMVRLGVVVWSGFIITLNYVELPMVRKPLGASSDITFVASIFTGALATFGLSTGNGKKNGNGTKQEKKRHEKMDSSLSTVVTRSSESKHNYAPVYTGEYELDYHYHSDNTRNNKSRSIWSRSKNLVWNKCNSIWRHLRCGNNLQYHDSRSRLSVRSNRKSSWSNRNNRYRQGYYNRFHYYFLLSLLTVSPAYADSKPETNNVSNPVAAATGNVTNQAVQFQNNGAPSRQYYGPSISCNGSTMTLSPFYMGNHSKPWEINENMGMDPSSYTISENWGFQINFAVPLDKRGLEQCRRMAARQEEK